MTSYGVALNATLDTQNLSYRYKSPRREDGVPLVDSTILQVVRHNKHREMPPKLVKLKNGEVGVRIVPKPIIKNNPNRPKLDLGTAEEQALYQLIRKPKRYR